MINNNLILFGMIRNSKNLLDYNQQEHQKVNYIYDHMIDKIRDHIAESDPIHYQNKYGDECVANFDHIKKAKDNPYQLVNMYANLNKSLDTYTRNKDLVEAFYHPFNIMANFLSANSRNKFMLKDLIRKYQGLIKHSHSTVAHPLFSQLYMYPNYNTGFYYQNIQQQGLAYLKHKSLHYHYHFILHLRPELPQLLIPKHNNTQVINNQDIQQLQDNFATKKDFSAFDIDKEYKKITESANE